MTNVGKSQVIISGGGDENDSKLHHEKFVHCMARDRRLLYVPGDAFPPADSFRWLSEVLQPLGVGPITMWADLEEDVQDSLDEYDGVYVGGGNTFHLLEKARRSGFDVILKAAIVSGKPFFGGSAGAILAGSDISTCAHMDPNDKGLQDTRGLDVLSELAVWCHYSDADLPRIKVFLSDHKKGVIALSESSGAFFNGGSIECIGGGRCLYFSASEGSRSIEPGETLSLAA